MGPEPKHIYTVDADDSSFACLPTVSSFLKTLLGDKGRPVAPRMLRDFLAFHEACVQQKAAGDGAGIAEAHVIVMPGGERPKLALLWRQAASTTAEVASEFPMPWLAVKRPDPEPEPNILAAPAPTRKSVARPAKACLPNPSSSTAKLRRQLCSPG